jgi:hypothetical protein
MKDQAYNVAKNNAKRRGIPFLLTEEEWYGWWQASGHYHERGTRKGQYVMARIGDVGPYALDNIVCITHAENSRFANRGNKHAVGQGHKKSHAVASLAAFKAWETKRARRASGVHQP